MNRPLLIERRYLHRSLAAQQEELAQSQQAGARLQEEIRALKMEIRRLRASMADVLRRGEK